LVFGHSVIKDDDNKEMNISSVESENYYLEVQYDDARVSEAGSHIREYYVTNSKSTKKIIEENRLFFNKLKSANDIYVLGHSISDVDILYFSEITKISKNAMWHVSWYDMEDKDNKLKSLGSIGINEEDVDLFQL